LQAANSITTTPEAAAALPSRGRRRPSPLSLSPSRTRRGINKPKQSKAKAKPHLLHTAPHLVVCFSSVRHKPLSRRLHYRAVRASVVAVWLAAAVMVEMDGGVGVVGGGQQTPAPRRWRLADELRCDLRAMETDYVRRFHRHEPRDHQCSSAVAKHIKAPVHLVSACLSTSSIPSMPLNQININLGYYSCCFFFPCSMASRVLHMCCPVDPPQSHRFDVY